MRFRPRHYILIAVILAIGVYNFVRSRRTVHQVRSTGIINIPAGPIPQSAAWQAFDSAAGLRDAGDAQFQPALSALKQQIQTASADQKSDLDGCEIWLLFYRQNMHSPANDSWRQRSTQHLDSCARYHRDLSS